MSRSTWFSSRRSPVSLRSNRNRKPVRFVKRPVRRGLQLESLEDRMMLSANVYTDQADYAPGETAYIAATDFAVGEAVQFQVLHTDGTPNTGSGHLPWTVVDGSADDLDGLADGNVHTSWYVDPDDSGNSAFVLTAKGLSSAEFASVTFTDDGNGTPTNITTQPGWFDVNGTNPVTTINAPSGFIINKVAIKSGSNSFVIPSPDNPDPGDDNTSNQHSGVITADGTYGLGNGFTVSGIGTSTVTVTKNSGSKDISHVDYMLQSAPKGSITVIKDAVPDSSQNFTFDPSSNLQSANFQLDDDANNTLSNTKVFSNLVAGTYTVQEISIPSGWNLSNIVVTGAVNSVVQIGSDSDFDAGDSKVSIALAAGENVTIKYTNTKLGSLRVIKDAVPNSSQDFTFDPSSNLQSSNFLLDDDSNPPLSNTKVFSNLLPGTYTVEEISIPAGWNLSNIIVSGAVNSVVQIGSDSDFDAGDSLVSVALAAGENVTLTYVNSRQGRIIVEKQTNPDGSVETFEFDPSYGNNFTLADNGQNDSGFLAPGSYTVAELAKAGWDLSNVQIVSGDTDHGSTISGSTATIDLDAGETIKVRFTNTQQGRIIVEKQTNPDGSLDSFEFDSSYGNNFTLADNGQNNSGYLTPGSYTVEELVKSGWDLTNVEIVSGDLDDGSSINGNTATIDLDPGEEITVRFTNTKKPCIIVIGPDKGKSSVPIVKLINQETGEELNQFCVFEPSFRGGVKVATGDMDGDGIDEIIVSTGQGRVGEVRVFTQDGIELTQFRVQPYGSSYKGGVEVEVGDVNGDGKLDIVTTNSYGPTEVRVFYSTYDSLLPLNDAISDTPDKQFAVYPSKFRGGADVVVADMGTFLDGATIDATTPDGMAEIIVGNGAGLRSTIYVYDVSGTPTVVDTILPFSNSFKGGVTLSTARVNSDLIPDLIVASGIKGGSAIEIWDGLTNDLADVRLSSFTAFGNVSTKNAPVHATGIDTDGDDIIDLIAAVQGTNGTSNQIRYFRPDGTALGAFNGFNGSWNIASSCKMNPNSHEQTGFAATDHAFSQIEEEIVATIKKKKKKKGKKK